MQIAHKTLGAIQNMGWLDRVVRVLIGVSLIAVVFVDLYRGMPLGWHAYLPIVAFYPMLTGILGWDPFYAMGHIKTCDTSDMNQCGTFPYEMESASGKQVHCGDGYDCSVPGSHDNVLPVTEKKGSGQQ